ncbi:hypothetical protein LB571_03920 [Mesorhizobium sp. BR1-1-4]|nr:MULTISPECIES: hypothetical protein [unclassified Mesorhizobium]MBZ9683842.1 hypothetical protein [Mesorhizobium sp. CO1-1-2]MBZ9923634.1 hypothetical protein [Mesorhizobium sp. BR1-1-4]
MLEGKIAALVSYNDRQFVVITVWKGVFGHLRQSFDRLIFDRGKVLAFRSLIVREYRSVVVEVEIVERHRRPNWRARRLFLALALMIHYRRQRQPLSHA